MKKTVLFVCTGNVCRSPMAEGFFRHRAADSKAFEIQSAGLGAMDGQPPSEHSVQALQEFGIDISRLRSQGITADLVNRADYIFGMTSHHVDAIRMMYPHAAEKTFLLNEFTEGLQGIEKEIADPIGGSYAVYVQCRDQIQKAIDSIMKFIEASQSKDNNPAPAGVAIAVGADHAGYELKQSLVNVLKEGGFQVDDLGAHSSASTDYPDYAQAVARKVSSGEAPFGMLVCSSGIGMSIAANKHRNVRAALVSSEGLARLSREHNDANVLCLGGNFITQEEAEKIVRAFFTSEFQGGRHARRLSKLEIYPGSCSQHTQKTDPEIAKVLEDERRRQQENVELIASENFTSQAVMEATGSVLTNKYAEGYPGKRWYGGCEHVDVAETAAIDRAKELFGAEHANVQPHSGSGANMAVYFSMLQPGDKMLTMDLSHGGHLTHGNKANFSGKFFEIVHYGVRKEDERIDYDQLGVLAREHRPKMITVGASAYPRIIDFERMAEIAHEVGALLLADIAHIAGLVAAGLHPSPVPHADFVTTTTHKTLRGPRGGLILCREEFAKKIDSQTFPGIQGGPLMHVIAAKAVCLMEASQPEFKAYQGQIIQNAQALAERIAEKDFRLVSGGTDNHVMLVDVGEKGLNGKECQAALDEAGITTNKNTIPFETLSPFKASGIRLGTPAVTTRGMKEPEMVEIADLIAEVLFDIKNVDAAHKVRERVRELTARFPLPY